MVDAGDGAGVCGAVGGVDLVDESASGVSHPDGALLDKTDIADGDTAVGACGLGDVRAGAARIRHGARIYEFLAPATRCVCLYAAKLGDAVVKCAALETVSSEVVT